MCKDKRGFNISSGCAKCTFSDVKIALSCPLHAMSLIKMSTILFTQLSRQPMRTQRLIWASPYLGNLAIYGPEPLYIIPLVNILRNFNCVNQ